MRPIYFGRYPQRETLRSRIVEIEAGCRDIRGSKFPFFAIWLFLFSCVMLWMKNFEIHTIKRCYQEEHLEFFSEFLVHILRQQWDIKWKKRDFNTFEVVQYAILRVPSNRFQRIIAQMIGFTERNIGFFFRTFRSYRSAETWLEVRKTWLRTSENVSQQGT